MEEPVSTPATKAGLTVPGAFRTILPTSTPFRGGKMPKIRHLAIKTKDPARLAKFYEEVFGMKLIHSERSGAMYMSDGYLTLAILRNRGDATPSGINHFGFQVDDLSDIEQKLAKWNEPMAGRPSTRPFAEHRAMDPDGNLFDISVHGYDHVEFADQRDAKKSKAKAPA
jgi:catechol 2,3-dioxygenase-like lactoylglutathione lyase family enzyme